MHACTGYGAMYRALILVSYLNLHTDVKLSIYLYVKQNSYNNMSFMHTHTDAVVMTQSVNSSAASVSSEGGESQSGGPSITIKIQSSDKSIVYSLSKVSNLKICGARHHQQLATVGLSCI